MTIQIYRTSPTSVIFTYFQIPIYSALELNESVLSDLSRIPCLLHLAKSECDPGIWTLFFNGISDLQTTVELIADVLRQHGFESEIL